METSNLAGLFVILRIKPYFAPGFINLKYAKLRFRFYQTAAVTVQGGPFSGLLSADLSNIHASIASHFSL